MRPWGKKVMARGGPTCGNAHLLLVCALFALVVFLSRQPKVSRRCAASCRVCRRAVAASAARAELRFPDGDVRLPHDVLSVTVESFDVRALQRRIDRCIHRLGPDRETMPVTVLFHPGEYHFDVLYLGYYTAVVGLGEAAGDVVLSGDLRFFDEPNRGAAHWRLAENLTLGGRASFLLATSQMAPLRRVIFSGELELGPGGVGFLSDVQASQIIARTETLCAASCTSSDHCMCQNQAAQQHVLLRVAARRLDDERVNSYPFVLLYPRIAKLSPRSPTGAREGSRTLSPSEWRQSGPWSGVYEERGISNFFKPFLTRSGVRRRDGWFPGVAYITYANFEKLYDLRGSGVEEGTCIVVLPGKYVADSPIEINVDGVCLMGAGFAIVHSNVGGDAIRVSGEGCVLCNLVFDAACLTREQDAILHLAGARAEVYDVTCRVQAEEARAYVPYKHGAAAAAMVRISGKDAYCENTWLCCVREAVSVVRARHGLVVHADGVRCVGLFVDGVDGRSVAWEGESGAVMGMRISTESSLPMYALGPLVSEHALRGAVLERAPPRLQFSSPVAVSASARDETGVALQILGRSRATSRIAFQDCLIHGEASMPPVQVLHAFGKPVGKIVRDSQVVAFGALATVLSSSAAGAAGA